MECPKCHYDNPADSKYCKECGTKISPAVTETIEAPKKELTTGSTFAGRYQIVEELGKGGMGKVYRALDKQLNEEVAIKLIKPEIGTDKKTVERFSNELKLARKIAHKNVGRMYELMEEKETRFITMEYVSGQDLKGLIRQTVQLAVGTTINIAKQVCEGLSEAHKLGVVHRDLKPSNIMIDREGNVRIMDFGIARSLKEKGITHAGVMIGTPEYMSPEQVDGKEVDQRSDIYSMGVILYEMVTGKVPFEGDTALSIAVKHKTESPPDPKEVNSQIPEELSRLILRCMEKGREKRHQSAEELLSELTKIEKGILTTERIVSEMESKVGKIGGIGWKKSSLYGAAAALVILLIVVGFSLFTGRQEVMDSIAVLPLENQSGDPGQEYFADGMTDALITELSKIGALRVISRTSVMRYKGTEKLLPEIARELGVDVLVEGSVLHAEDKVRIMVQLIKATPEKHLWADDYERDLNNVIAMQKEIAQAIAREIKITIRPEEKARLTKSRSINPEAYQIYLKGRFFWNKRTEEGVRNGHEYFQKAIEKDPTYALAYVGLADSYIITGWYDWASPQETFPKAKRAAEKALEIDNTLADAHTSLAAVSWLYEWDWLSSEREFKRAIEINPSHATAHRWYASYLLSMDRYDEALAESRRALELDPISLIANAYSALVLLKSRRPEDAIKQLQKTLEMDPNFVPAYNYLCIAYLDKEMYQDAIAAIQKAVNLSQGDPSHLSLLGSAYAAAGKRDKALEILAELNEISKQRYVSSFSRARIHLNLGDIDQFFEWIERAYQERNWSFASLNWTIYDSVRSDPRFKALLKKVGLE